MGEGGQTGGTRQCPDAGVSQGVVFQPQPDESCQVRRGGQGLGRPVAQAIAEGRDAIQDLRSEPAVQTDLEHLLKAMVKNWRAHGMRTAMLRTSA